MFFTLWFGHLLIRHFFLDGFFDAGMLQAALKARGEDAGRPSETIVERRAIGRRLTLAEY